MKHRKEIAKGMDIRNELMAEMEGKFVANEDRKPPNRKFRRKLNKFNKNKKGLFKV